MVDTVNCWVPPHPLAEVFGYPIDNHGREAQLARDGNLCPFHNRVPECTKNSVDKPLGVCSIYSRDQVVITCPIRFRENWLVVEDVAQFFFPSESLWTFLTEVRLTDADGRSAGNIDMVLVSYDQAGKVLDFGALEIQSVYISGNVTNPFESYMSDTHNAAAFKWNDSHTYPRPDFLSSSRKRLAPQLTSKGGILNAWGKKIAVALDEPFYATLPSLPEVSPEVAEVAWLIYGLELDTISNRYVLQQKKMVYTMFDASLNRISTSRPGHVSTFEEKLSSKLRDKLQRGNAP